MTDDELLDEHATAARAYFAEHPEATTYEREGRGHRVRAVLDGDSLVVSN